jgi:hypothetical protein
LTMFGDWPIHSTMMTALPKRLAQVIRPSATSMSIWMWIRIANQQKQHRNTEMTVISENQKLWLQSIMEVRALVLFKSGGTW